MIRPQFEPSETVSTEFFEHLVATHALGHEGFHGRSHWLRVLQNARELATATGANQKVLELFAVLHDSQRINENYDPEHGQRASSYAAQLRGQWFELTDTEMALLTEACKFHSDGLTEAHPTIQACWDADRLDLGRVGIRPTPQFLCTDYAKQPEVIEAAYIRSTMGSTMQTDDFNSAETNLMLSKLLDDWGSDFMDVTVLTKSAEIIAVDRENLTRVVRTLLCLLPDNDAFEFARTIPNSFLTEERTWLLTWVDEGAFDDPLGFEESVYDREGVDIGTLEWDDPNLPDAVFELAIAHIDWWATGEWLEEWDSSISPKFSAAPVRLKPYLQNAVALTRRRMLGRWGYMRHLLSHPKFLWGRIRHYRQWRELQAAQNKSFW